MFNSRRWVYWIAAVLALAFGAPLLFAQSGKPLNPKVAALIPEKPSNYLTDLAGVVKNPDEVNHHLSHLRDSLKLSLVAVTLPTIGDLAVEEVALDIGRRWQVATANDTIGAAVRNTGGVILLVMDTRKCRIEVATGSEGYMTDARAGDLCRAARTQFRAGDFGRGIIEISSGFASFHAAELAAAQSVRPSSPSSSDSDSSFGVAFFLVLFALVLVGVMLYIRSERIRREEEERRSEELRQFNEKQRKIREQREKEAAIRREEERREEERRWNSLTPEQQQAELALRRKREVEEAERRAIEAEKRRKREAEEAERRRIQRERDDEDRRRRSSYDSIIVTDFGSSRSSSSNSDSSWSSGGSDSFSGGGGGSDW